MYIYCILRPQLVIKQSVGEYHGLFLFLNLQLKTFKFSY